MDKVAFALGLEGQNGVSQEPRRKQVTVSTHKGRRQGVGDTELYSPGFSKAAPQRKKRQSKWETRKHKPVAVGGGEP